MKWLAVFSVGAVFAAAMILMGPFSPLKTNADTGEGDMSSMVPASISEFDEFYEDALTLPLKEARASIYDPDIAAYYDKLLGKLHIGDSAPSGQ